MVLTAGLEWPTGWLAGNWQMVAVMNLIIGLASLTSSLTGFGYALVATPFMVLLFPPRLVVPVVMLSWAPLAVLLVKESSQLMHYRRIGRWLAGALVGLPFGVYGLARFEAETMRLVIGGITLAAAFTLWLKPARPLAQERPLAVLTGLLSGAMGGATGMSGPPVILFGLNQGWERRELRANLIGYFAVKHAIALFLLQEFGILSREILILGVAVLPGMGIGYTGGMRLKERISGPQLRRLTFVLICLGGLLAMVNR